MSRARLWGLLSETASALAGKVEDAEKRAQIAQASATYWREAATIENEAVATLTARNKDLEARPDWSSPQLERYAAEAQEGYDNPIAQVAFRAGFLAGVAWRLPYERAAQLGAALATVALESVGAQEYKLVAADVVARLEAAYGHVVAGEVEPALTAPPPALDGADDDGGEPHIVRGVD